MIEPHLSSLSPRHVGEGVRDTIAPRSAEEKLDVIPTPETLDLLVQTLGLPPHPSSNLNLFDIVHRLALENWLTDIPQDTQAIATAEEAKPLIEACYHSCSLRSWQEAYRFASLPIGTSQISLHECLGRWGKFDDQVQLYTYLLHQISPAIDLICLDGLGQAHLSVGETQLALDYYDQHRSLAQSLADLGAEANAYGRLGHILHEQAQYDAAIAQYQRQYDLAIQSGDVFQQASALQCIGYLHLCEQRIQKGQAILRQAWAIAQSLSNPDLEANINLAIGFGYLWSQKPNRAMPYFQASLAHTRRIHDIKTELKTLRNLGMAYLMSHPSQIETALTYWQNALSLSRTVKAIHDEEIILTDLAIVYSHYQPDPEQGISYMEQAIALLKKRGSNQHRLASYLARLAWLYVIKQDVQTAEMFLEQAFQLYDDYENTTDVTTLMVLVAVRAKLRWHQKRYLSAIGHLGKSFWLCPPWRYANGHLLVQVARATIIQPIISRLSHGLKKISR